MCKVCGDEGHKAPVIDEIFGDVSENVLVALHRIGDQSLGDAPARPGALMAAVALVVEFGVEGMPVPAVETIEGGGLGMDFRSGNRIVEVEVFPDGESFEFVAAQIDGDDGENLELVYQMGLFTFADVRATSSEDRGPGALADWLVGGEFAKSLDRYIYTEDLGDSCSPSDTGFEPTNITEPA